MNPKDLLVICLFFSSMLFWNCVVTVDESLFVDAKTGVIFSDGGAILHLDSLLGSENILPNVNDAGHSEVGFSDTYKKDSTIIEKDIFIHEDQFHADAATDNNLSSFFDDFDDNSLNAYKWTTFKDGGIAASVFERNQQLEIPISSSLKGYGGIESVKKYDATGEIARIELKSAGSQTNHLGVGFMLKQSDVFKVGFEIQQNTLYAVTEKNNGSSFLAAIPYIPSEARYLQLRESAGTTFWEYGPSLNNLKKLASSPNAINMKEVTVVLWAGVDVSIANSTTIVFDNFNCGS